MEEPLGRNLKLYAALLAMLAEAIRLWVNSRSG